MYLRHQFGRMLGNSIISTQVATFSVQETGQKYPESCNSPELISNAAFSPKPRLVVRCVAAPGCSVRLSAPRSYSDRNPAIPTALCRPRTPTWLIAPPPSATFSSPTGLTRFVNAGGGGSSDDYDICTGVSPTRLVHRQLRHRSRRRPHPPRPRRPVRLHNSRCGLLAALPLRCLEHAPKEVL